jgi:hypothetical protein
MYISKGVSKSFLYDDEETRKMIEQYVYRK